jgi:MFS family permease
MLRASLLCAAVVTFLCVGPLYGWAAIISVLGLQHGQLDYVQLSLIYTIAVLMQSALSLPAGYILDRFGFMSLVVISTVLHLVSIVTINVAIIPGILILASASASSNLAAFAVIPLLRSFAERTFASALLSSIFDLSALVYSGVFVIAILPRSSARIGFFVYAGLVLIANVCFVLAMKNEERLNQPEIVLNKSTEINLQGTVNEETQKSVEVSKRSWLFSFNFIRLVLYLNLECLRCNWVISTLKLQFDKDLGSDYPELSVIGSSLISSGVLFFPFFHRLISLIGFSKAALFIDWIGAVGLVFLSFPTIWSKVLGSFFIGIFRTYLYAFGSASVADLVPDVDFGKAYGITCISMGVTQCLQYLLLCAIIAQPDPNFKIGNFSLLGITAISWFLYLIRTSNQETSQYKNFQ